MVTHRTFNYYLGLFIIVQYTAMRLILLGNAELNMYAKCTCVIVGLSLLEWDQQQQSEGNTEHVCRQERYAGLKKPNTQVSEGVQADSRNSGKGKCCIGHLTSLWRKTQICVVFQGTHSLVYVFLGITENVSPHLPASNSVKQ